MVRLEWVRVYRQLLAGADCRPLLGAVRDTSAHVQLAAIDALGGACPEQQGVVAELGRLILNGPRGGAARLGARGAWYVRAHALVALARVRPQAARALFRSDALHPVWQARLYAARAAAVARDTLTLTRLAHDSIGSVQEVAIDGLATVAGHASDAVYLRALRSRDYHVVRAAARALAGTPAPDSVRPALLDALDRITRERRETSRDPRMELLVRIGELGDSSLTSRLSGYLRDFDPAVADRAAAILTSWRPGGPAYRADPELLPVDRGPLQTFRARPATRLRVTMAPASGGGQVVLRLHPEVAPAAVARVVWLVRRGYYDGLSWHRVVPNFVIQGGSPGMNEYVGDGPFMRDELGGLSHLRGTVGISTRGHDTGDAQWFVNLVDNLRLDPDYTVFATVETGMDVVDRILEGDVMMTVEVLPPP
jgi:cyclophilin family peptidyl-prolyl cis-trans isomerase